MNVFINHNFFSIGVILFSLLLGACGGSITSPGDAPSFPGTASLTWIAPNTNEDDSQLDDLAGYKVYYGTSADSLTNVIAINDSGQLNYIINGLENNVTYYFAVKAVDYSGNESMYSNVVSKLIQG